MNSSIKNGDWNSVRQAIQRIETRLGESASPSWPGATFDYLTVNIDLTVGNDASVGNDLTVTNDIIVGGLVDGRDIAADGAAQDAHIADNKIHVNRARRFFYAGF